MHAYTAVYIFPISKDRNDAARRLDEITRRTGRGGLSAHLADKLGSFLSETLDGNLT